MRGQVDAQARTSRWALLLLLTMTGTSGCSWFDVDLSPTPDAAPSTSPTAQTGPPPVSDIARVEAITARVSDRLGEAPGVPWITPGWEAPLAHWEGARQRLPRGSWEAGVLGSHLVVAGGCLGSEDRCSDRLPGGVHLLAPDGELTTLATELGPHRVHSVVDSADGSAIVWATRWRGESYLFGYEEGDEAPTEITGLVPAGSHVVPVGILGEDDALISYGEERPDRYVRSSRGQAWWKARFLDVVAPGVLLGDPLGTTTPQSCHGLYVADDPFPRWTRCYTADGRPADLGPLMMTSNRRWLVALDGSTSDVLVIDARTGKPARRLRFPDRPQQVVPEGDSHVLVVLTREGRRDAWAQQWIVRCTITGRCERATSTRRPPLYETLALLAPGRSE
ncbi:hypothetical protein [Nocardioides coralli]|uniref:hypothetical protein n=1 Tax=Nocardioides coralli TaxID=2872154 RepID=UPI001CA4073E|nr:hypothetical protein [Nocardioides coralli]QZY28406.1 hypothetical protein K6T13_13140 [Nocardioides coralli]